MHAEEEVWQCSVDWFVLDIQIEDVPQMPRLLQSEGVSWKLDSNRSAMVREWNSMASLFVGH